MKKEEIEVKSNFSFYFNKREESKNNASSTLFISLYFIVLVFFIVLSSLTVFVPDKVRAVKASIKETFSPVSFTDLSDRFINLFQEEIALRKEGNKDIRSNLFYLSFSPDRLFSSKGEKINFRYKPTLEKLYNFLKEDQNIDSLQIELKLIYPSSDFMDDSLSKVSFLAEEFRKQGIAVSCSIIKGKEYRLLIIISQTT